MKVCLVSQTFSPQPEGGAEIVCRQLANSLSGRHEIVVLALGKAGSNQAPLGECATGANYRLYRVAFRNSHLPGPGRLNASLPRKALWHLRSAVGAVNPTEVRQFLINEAFDLLYVHNAIRMQPALYDAAKELGIPVIQHLHDYAILCPKTTMFDHGKNCSTPCMTCRLLTMRARNAAQSVETVIAVSQFVADRHHSNGVFPSAKWHILHNLNLPVTKNLNAAPQSNMPEGKALSFAYLSALTNEKGIETVLMAFKNLADEFERETAQIQLLIAGRCEDGYLKKLKALIAGSAAEYRVEWLGFVAPEQVYRKADVVLVPSLWHEPQSRILIEAAAFGIPVFAATTGGTTEVVQQYGTGWLYEPNETDQLIALMRRAANLGAKRWHECKDSFFPQLKLFCGSIDQSDYLIRLEHIIEKSVAGGKKLTL